MKFSKNIFKKIPKKKKKNMVSHGNIQENHSFDVVKFMRNIERCIILNLALFFYEVTLNNIILNLVVV